MFVKVKFYKEKKEEEVINKERGQRIEMMMIKQERPGSFAIYFRHSHKLVEHCSLS